MFAGKREVLLYRSEEAKWFEYGQRVFPDEREVLQVVGDKSDLREIRWHGNSLIAKRRSS